MPYDIAVALVPSIVNKDVHLHPLSLIMHLQKY